MAEKGDSEKKAVGEELSTGLMQAPPASEGGREPPSSASLAAGGVGQNPTLTSPASKKIKKERVSNDVSHATGSSKKEETGEEGDALVAGGINHVSTKESACEERLVVFSSFFLFPFRAASKRTMTTNLTLFWPFYSFLKKGSGRNTRSGGQDNISASSSSSGLSQKPGAYAEGGDGGNSSLATSEENDQSITQPQEESYDNTPIEAELAVDDTVERRRLRQDDEIELVHAEPALDEPKGADEAEGAENHRQSWIAQKRNKFILLLLSMLAVGLVLAVVLLFSSAENDPKPAPSSTPTATPTASPTISLAPTSFSDRLFNLLATFTPENILQDSSAPQFQAFQWVVGNKEPKESSVGSTDEVTLERYALATLFFATDGIQWSSNNTFLVEESHCDWDGVECAADEEVITALSLPSENLSGTLPPEIGILTSLTSLNLTNQNATEPGLTGTIPSEIGLLTSLITLDISNNRLSGSIPSEIRNLDNIRTIALHNNRLEGFVPIQLGFLRNLEHLSLEKNLLTGGIPLSLCSPSFSSIQSISADCLSISDSIPSEVACRCCNLCCDFNDFCRDDLDVTPFPTFPPTDDDGGDDSCRKISVVSTMTWGLAMAFSISIW